LAAAGVIRGKRVSAYPIRSLDPNQVLDQLPLSWATRTSVSDAPA
jgi:hypothetical protein